MLAAFCVMAVLAVTAAGVALGSAVIARHRAQSAADLAALAAAGMLPGGASAACGRAEHLAAVMRTQLVGCQVHGLDVTVRVSIATPLGATQAGATAGPI